MSKDLQRPLLAGVLIAIILIFGGKKLPELVKGLGQGLKEFKQAMNSLDEESDISK